MRRDAGGRAARSRVGTFGISLGAQCNSAPPMPNAFRKPITTGRCRVGDRDHRDIVAVPVHRCQPFFASARPTSSSSSSRGGPLAVQSPSRRCGRGGGGGGLVVVCPRTRADHAIFAVAPRRAATRRVVEIVEIARNALPTVAPWPRRTHSRTRARERDAPKKVLHGLWRQKDGIADSISIDDRESLGDSELSGYTPPMGWFSRLADATDGGASRHRGRCRRRLRQRRDARAFTVLTDALRQLIRWTRAGRRTFFEVIGIARTSPTSTST